jgi:hypothetical protein
MALRTRPTRLWNSQAGSCDVRFKHITSMALEAAKFGDDRPGL